MELPILVESCHNKQFPSMTLGHVLACDNLQKQQCTSCGIPTCKLKELPFELMGHFCQGGISQRSGALRQGQTSYWGLGDKRGRR